MMPKKKFCEKAEIILVAFRTQEGERHKLYRIFILASAPPPPVVFETSLSPSLSPPSDIFQHQRL